MKAGVVPSLLRLRPQTYVEQKTDNYKCIKERGAGMVELGLNQLDLFSSKKSAIAVTYQTSRADIIERETRKLETIAKHHHNGKDPAERAELALQVDAQLDHLKRLEKGL